jgi:hypothetical protein
LIINDKRENRKLKIEILGNGMEALEASRSV